MNRLRRKIQRSTLPVATALLLFGAAISALVPVGGLAWAQALYDRHVVVLAIDGLRADVLEQYAFEGKGNPPKDSLFRKLSRPDGAYRRHLNVRLTSSVFPTYTFAAWASIFTGTHPGKHGILGQSFYCRDLGSARGYDNSDDAVVKLLTCDIPDFLQIYGWTFNCAQGYLAIAAMLVSLKSGLASLAYLADPQVYLDSSALLELTTLGTIGLTVTDLFNILDRPYIWVVIPSGFYIPVPLYFKLFDLDDSGGVQNGDLLRRTLYDYASDMDLKTYVIHNFYNRSRLNQTGQKVSWESVYGNDLDGMDESWGRPSWEEVLDFVVDGSDNNKIYDQIVVSKAKDYVNKNGLPHILTLYFSAIDGECHHYPDAKFGHKNVEQAQFKTLRRNDVWLSDFVSFLKTRKEYANTIFLLVADHGHTQGKRGYELDMLPKDTYEIQKNGYMFHIYIKNSNTGSWDDLPTHQDYSQFMNKVLPDPTYAFWNDIEVVLARDPQTGIYKAYRWKKNAWVNVPLDNLEELDYPDPETRIPGANNINRSGDVIFLPKEGVGHTKSTHGGLRESDTDVPLYIWGEPITKARDFAKSKKPWVLCGASLVDVTPTILNMFGIYEPIKGRMDGKPLLDKDLRVNIKDFTFCRGSGASDFLFGHWKNFQGETTQILLHNPSSVHRDAVLLYYGWREDYKGFQFVRLSPHDYVELDPPVQGGGPVEIRAAPLVKEKRPGGLVGYVVPMSGVSTLGTVQLILDDPILFNLEKSRETTIQRATCKTLQQKGSPLQKLFCPPEEK